MTGAFRITGIRVHNPPLLGHGQRTLASAVVETDVFTVAGVSLIETDAGERLVFLPKFNGRARVILNRSVGFPALLEAVLTAYRALGGAPAVPAARDGPQAEHRHANHS